MTLAESYIFIYRSYSPEKQAEQKAFWSRQWARAVGRDLKANAEKHLIWIMNAEEENK